MIYHYKTLLYCHWYNGCAIIVNKSDEIIMINHS